MADENSYVLRVGRPYTTQPERLVAYHDDLIIQSAVKLAGNKDTAAEIAQGARVRLWTWALRRRAFRCSRRFVRSAVLSAAIDEARDRRRCVSPGDNVERLDDRAHIDFLLVEGTDEDVIGRQVVFRFMRGLRLQLRAVFCGLYRRGLSQREVARRMRLSQPRVAQLHDELLRRGREWFTRVSA